ncbi:transposase [Nostoc sp. FACHB-892]|nr:transposase [Nostoc sp. FACHB-892]
MAVDAKSIRCTLTDYSQSYQNFISVVSVFSHQRGVVVQNLEAQQLLADTQGHWGIENRLHWVKDVTFSEDFPLRRGGNAPVNWAILHSFFITIRSPDFLVSELFFKHNVPYPTNSKRFFLCLYETTLLFNRSWGDLRL